MLRMLDEQIGAIELRVIPKPEGQGELGPAIESLEAEIEQLCRQRADNVREHHRWFAAAERSVLAGDDVMAKEAFSNSEKHLQLAREADALLAEFQGLIRDTRRSLSNEDEATI